MPTIRRVRYLGDYTTDSLFGPAWDDWSASIDAQLQGLYGDSWQTHGAATNLPSSAAVGTMAQYAGRPAARYDVTTYATLFNAGQIDTTAPQVTNPTGSLVYVMAPTSTWATAPHTMTTSESVENAIFTTGDQAAGALGLPSLASIESFLTSIGRDVLIGVAVAVAGAYIIKRLTK
jgi:hypothetical protein